jgi:hypothetical protein
VKRLNGSSLRRLVKDKSYREPEWVGTSISVRFGVECLLVSLQNCNPRIHIGTVASMYLWTLLSHRQRERSSKPGSNFNQHVTRTLQLGDQSRWTIRRTSSSRYRVGAGPLQAWCSPSLWICHLQNVTAAYRSSRGRMSRGSVAPAVSKSRGFVALPCRFKAGPSTFAPSPSS